MILIRALTVQYGGKPVLHQLEASFQSGMIHGIVGLNGAGKTTLLNTLYGLVKPDTGTLHYQGVPLTKKHIAYLEAENYFYANLTGREYLRLLQDSANVDWQTWNQLFELPLDALIDTYSTGMKKKLAIAGVLQRKKPVYILDEPFNGLDIESARKLKMLMVALKEKGSTVLVTSHILEILTNTCDCIHYLRNKIIEKTVFPDEFRTFEKALYTQIDNETSAVIKKII